MLPVMDLPHRQIAHHALVVAIACLRQVHMSLVFVIKCITAFKTQTHPFLNTSLLDKLLISQVEFSLLETCVLLVAIAQKALSSLFHVLLANIIQAQANSTPLTVNHVHQHSIVQAHQILQEQIS
jgi:hypothetical protein